MRDRLLLGTLKILMTRGFSIVLDGQVPMDGRKKERNKCERKWSMRASLLGGGKVIPSREEELLPRAARALQGKGGSLCSAQVLGFFGVRGFFW